jgi:hypothetical protein
MPELHRALNNLDVTRVLGADELACQVGDWGFWQGRCAGGRARRGTFRGVKPPCRTSSRSLSSVAAARPSRLLRDTHPATPPGHRALQDAAPRSDPRAPQHTRGDGGRASRVPGQVRRGVRPGARHGSWCQTWGLVPNFDRCLERLQTSQAPSSSSHCPAPLPPAVPRRHSGMWRVPEPAKRVFTAGEGGKAAKPTQLALLQQSLAKLLRPGRRTRQPFLCWVPGAHMFSANLNLLFDGFFRIKAAIRPNF